MLNLGGHSDTVRSVKVEDGQIINGTLTSSAHTAYAGSINASLGGSGQFMKDTSGVVTLSGHNTYQGGTVVTGGTLIITSADALPDGTSLTIGASGSVVLGSGLGRTIELSSLSFEGFSGASTTGGKTANGPTAQRVTATNVEQVSTISTAGKSADASATVADNLSAIAVTTTSCRMPSLASREQVDGQVVQQSATIAQQSVFTGSTTAELADASTSASGNPLSEGVVPATGQPIDQGSANVVPLVQTLVAPALVATVAASPSHRTLLMFASTTSLGSGNPVALFTTSLVATPAKPGSQGLILNTTAVPRSAVFSAGDTGRTDTAKTLKAKTPSALSAETTVLPITMNPPVLLPSGPAATTAKCASHAPSLDTVTVDHIATASGFLAGRYAITRTSVVKAAPASSAKKTVLLKDTELNALVSVNGQSGNKQTETCDAVLQGYRVKRSIDLSWVGLVKKVVERKRSAQDIGLTPLSVDEVVARLWR